MKIFELKFKGLAPVEQITEEEFDEVTEKIGTLLKDELNLEVADTDLEVFSIPENPLDHLLGALSENFEETKCKECPSYDECKSKSKV